MGGLLTGLGQVAGTKPEAPSMSAEEKQIAEQYKQYQGNMMSEFAHQNHYNIGSDGTWNKMSDQQWQDDPRTTQEMKDQDKIYKSSLTRYQQALNGTLPLSESLKNQQQDEFKNLQGQSGIYGTNLANAKAGDTIGIQKINAANKRWDEIKSNEQQNQINTGAQNVMAGNQIRSNSGLMNNYQPLTGAAENAMAPYTQYNQAGYEADAAGMPINASILSGIGGIVKKKAVSAGLIGG
jgi:hypothetical protein